MNQVPGNCYLYAGRIICSIVYQDNFFLKSFRLIPILEYNVLKGSQECCKTSPWHPNLWTFYMHYIAIKN
jgi:hypothetical protein